VAITHFHHDHWGELPMLLYALRYGTLPARGTPVVLIGPPGFATRLHVLAGALGDWVLAPGYAVDVREIAAGGAMSLAPGVELQAAKTPHNEESLAYAVRADGARMVYTGDTGPSDTLAAWSTGCDLMVAECSQPDAQGIAIHLTPTQAGDLARAARARRLVLSHFYPQIEGTDPAGVAARTFRGDVVEARDGDRFTIGT
jgi:ribonuclease BN (tRNA processing enzyme)